MAWNWSHTDEGVQAVMNGIANQDRDWVNVVWAEWVTARKHSRDLNFHAEFDNRTYAHALARAAGKPLEALIEQIQNWTADYSTCTNGGHYAYCCPFGCSCHELPFSPEETPEGDDPWEGPDYANVTSSTLLQTKGR